MDSIFENKMGRYMHFPLSIMKAVPLAKIQKGKKRKNGSDRVQSGPHNYSFSTRQDSPKCLYRYDYCKYLVK